MIRVGVIGMGRWGKRLIDGFAAHAEVALCCNRSDAAAHAWLRERHPEARATHDAEEVFSDSSLTCVVIASPIATHARFAERALRAGKHVFVEKPLATTPAEADALVELARVSRRRLFVAHTFLFHPVMDELLEATRDDRALHLLTHWTKLGTFGEELIWNLVSHDVAIATALFRLQPTAVQLVDQRPGRARRDYVALRLNFPDEARCTIVVDRCSPVRRKDVTVLTQGGDLLVWSGDALHRLHQETFSEIFRSDEEPLAREVQTFLHAVTSGSATRSDGEFGAGVVHTLAELARTADEAASRRGASTEVLACPPMTTSSFSES